MANHYEYFGKYVLLEKLATGGMAEVFLARAPGVEGIGKFVAIKRILPQFAESPEFIDMFRDEAKIAINLSHSNIVSIHEFGVQSGQFYIVMDFVEGKNVRQILNKMKKVNQKFTIDQIAFVCKEIASGLDHAHRCLDGTTGKPLNITHRDMSPQNIMVSYEGEIKIVDFGIAKAESQLETTRAGTLKGKFGYMSPEQAEGQAVDLRTDIFSLGIVLWELLANDRLFVANNEINTLRKIRDCQIPSLRKINPNIHNELERIVLKALTRDRNLRYQTAAAFHRDLSRFLNRQYPDFSAHDFAVSIKTLFADEILVNRKKFIEYARVPTAAENDSTTTTGAQTSLTATTPTPLPSLSFESRPEQPVATVTHNTQGQSNDNINFERPEFAVQEAPKPAAEKPRQPSPLPTIDQNALSENPFAANEVHMESDPQQAQPHDEEWVPEADFDEFSFVKKRSNWFLQALVLGLFVFVSYAYMVKYYSAVMSPLIRITDPYLHSLHKTLGINGSNRMSSTKPAVINPPAVVVPPSVIQPPVVTAPSVPEEIQETEMMTSMIITTNPSGAEIYVNGKYSGAMTPARIELPNERYFNLSLKKSGYNEITRSAIDRTLPMPKMSFVLQKANLAYVDVDVKPPRPVNLYINGNKVFYEKLPVRSYAVPSETRVVVRAEDPVKRLFVERTIQLPNERSGQLLLDFRKAHPLPNRRPTSK